MKKYILMEMRGKKNDKQQKIDLSIILDTLSDEHLRILKFQLEERLKGFKTPRMVVETNQTRLYEMIFAKPMKHVKKFHIVFPYVDDKYVYLTSSLRFTHSKTQAGVFTISDVREIINHRNSDPYNVLQAIEITL